MTSFLIAFKWWIVLGLYLDTLSFLLAFYLAKEVFFGQVKTLLPVFSPIGHKVSHTLCLAKVRPQDSVLEPI